MNKNYCIFLVDIENFKELICKGIYDNIDDATESLESSALDHIRCKEGELHIDNCIQESVEAIEKEELRNGLYLVRDDNTVNIYNKYFESEVQSGYVWSSEIKVPKVKKTGYFIMTEINIPIQEYGYQCSCNRVVETSSVPPSPISYIDQITQFINDNKSEDGCLLKPSLLRKKPTLSDNFFSNKNREFIHGILEEEYNLSEDTYVNMDYFMKRIYLANRQNIMKYPDIYDLDYLNNEVLKNIEAEIDEYSSDDYE